MSNLEPVLRAILSLAAVVVVMWLLARWARRRGRRRGGPRESLEVLARQSLTRNASVAVIRIADRAMVLGVTETHVSLLGEVSPDVFELAPVLTIASDPASELVTQSVLPLGTNSSFATVPIVATATEVRPPRAGRKSTKVAAALEGSALSLGTWSQAVNVLRERTVRR